MGVGDYYDFVSSPLHDAASVGHLRSRHPCICVAEVLSLIINGDSVFPVSDQLDKNRS